MRLPSALTVLLVVLLSLDLSIGISAASRPPPKKRSPPKPKPSPPRPKPPPPAPPPGPFPALTFVGCFDLVSADGYIDSYEDKPYGVNFQDCYQWAIQQLKPLLAITAYGECALGKTLGDFVGDDKDSTALALKIDSNRCDANCTGRTANSPASQLKCGGARNPDKGNIASIYKIDFSKVQVQVTPGTPPGCAPVKAPPGPVAPTITAGKFRIRYVPYAKYNETYLGWTATSPIVSDSLLFSVDKSIVFYVYVEKRAAITCTPNFYVWLTRTAATGVKYCVTYRLDGYMWEPCAAGSDAQLSILRPLPQPEGVAAMYELVAKTSGSCLYPLKGAAYSFTCGAIGSQLMFLPVT